MSRSQGALLVLLALAACRGGSAPGLTEPNPGYGQPRDEQKLIEESWRAEKEFEKRGLIFEDAGLEAYLEKVARPLIPEGLPAELRFHFRVLRDPQINAFAMDNGGIFLHTGILAALQNEAQLALVLGHELSHTVRRHQLNGLRSFKRKTVIAKVAATGLSPLAAGLGGGMGAADLTQLLLGLSYAATVTGYSRDLEREADELGIRAVAAAGYPPEEAAKLFDALNEVEEPGAMTVFFYSDHPANSDRSQYTRALIESNEIARNEDGGIGVQDYRSAVRGARLHNIELRIRARHYDFALREVERSVESYGDGARLAYLEGEVYRRMGEDPEGVAREAAYRARHVYAEGDLAEFQKKVPEMLASADSAYQRALGMDASLHAAHRGLGQVSLDRGDAAEGRRQLETYLENERDPYDRRFVEQLLRKLPSTPDVGLEGKR